MIDGANVSFEKLFEGIPMIWPTFLNTPPSESNANECKVWIIPVPYEATESISAGTRSAPKTIIEASKALEDFDIELGRDISKVGICTLPEIESAIGSPEAMISRVEKVTKTAMALGKLPILVGGEHTIAVGSSIAAKNVWENITVLYLDAHADMRDSFMGSRFGHATAARRIYENSRIIHVGLRSASEIEYKFIEEKRISNYPSPQSGSYKLSEIENICEDLTQNVYISIDFDVLDPSVIPATSAPEPGGLSWSGLTNLLRRICCSKTIVGMDFVELSPNLGPEYSAHVAAKLIYKMIGYCTATKNEH